MADRAPCRAGHSDSIVITDIAYPEAVGNNSATVRYTSLSIFRNAKRFRADIARLRSSLLSAPSRPATEAESTSVTSGFPAPHLPKPRFRFPAAKFASAGQACDIPPARAFCSVPPRQPPRRPTRRRTAESKPRGAPDLRLRQDRPNPPGPAPVAAIPRGHALPCPRGPIRHNRPGSLRPVPVDIRFHRGKSRSRRRPGLRLPSHLYSRGGVPAIRPTRPNRPHHGNNLRRDRNTLRPGRNAQSHSAGPTGIAVRPHHIRDADAAIGTSLVRLSEN